MQWQLESIIHQMKIGKLWLLNIIYFTKQNSEKQDGNYGKFIFSFVDVVNVMYVLHERVSYHESVTLYNKVSLIKNELHFYSIY